MNELIYTRQGDYLLPDLIPPVANPLTLGKFGRKRLNFLKTNKKGLYTNLLTTGKLDEHLTEIEQTAQARMEVLTSQMSQANGVTEELKARDQMQWVGMTNNIHRRAEEIILKELIYN